MRRAIVWFKTDLRLHDNETLVKAIAQNDEIIPIYCFDPADFKVSNFGFQKTGKFRAKFLLESLADLDQNLRQLGSGLLILRGNPETEIVNVVRKYGVQKLYSKKEVTPEEITTLQKVEKEVWRENCVVETFSTSTLYHAQDLPFPLKDIPDIFTNFRKRTEKDAVIRPVFAKPTLIQSHHIPPVELPTLKELGLENVKKDKRSAIDFKGGETSGCERINAFLFQSKAISTYKETRNELIGENYSSKFSAWLSLGCISPREIKDEIKRYELEYGENESTYWLIFELLWRDYFRFMMKKHKHQLFLPNGIKKVDDEPKKMDEVTFNAWKNGETGIDFIDANMIELKLTGFMSNRGRQNVASFFVHELGLDWRYGAAYFEEQLIDYDVCSNWGNWAYIAGVGNDPRGNRKFNIEKQAIDYDKNQQFRKLWLDT